MTIYYAVFRLRFNSVWSPIEGSGYYESPKPLTTRTAINEFVEIIAKSVQSLPEDVLLLNWKELSS